MMITQPPKCPKHGKKLIIGLIVTIAAILTVISVAGVGLSLSIRSYRVTVISMEPGLHNGQVVYISSLSYTCSSPSRGDLIIFHQPLSTRNSCQLPSPPGASLSSALLENQEIPFPSHQHQLFSMAAY
jgi:signal peptidase I